MAGSITTTLASSSSPGRSSSWFSLGSKAALSQSRLPRVSSGRLPFSRPNLNYRSTADLFLQGQIQAGNDFQPAALDALFPDGVIQGFQGQVGKSGAVIWRGRAVVSSRIGWEFAPRPDVRLEDAESEHLCQHLALTFARNCGCIDRVEDRGVHGCAQQGGFGQIEVLGGFIKIDPGSLIDAKGQLPKRGVVQIPLQDRLPAVGFGDLGSQQAGAPGALRAFLFLPRNRKSNTSSSARLGLSESIWYPGCSQNSGSWAARVALMIRIGDQFQVEVFGRGSVGIFEGDQQVFPGAVVQLGGVAAESHPPPAVRAESQCWADRWQLIV